jgi:portal protein
MATPGRLQPGYPGAHPTRSVYHITSQSQISLFSKLRSAYAAFRGPDLSTRGNTDDAQPPGRFSYGSSTQGGPPFVDPFKSRPAPSLAQLIDNYSSLIYAMVARNRNAVSRLPMRLLADGSRVQGGVPGRACDPIRVSRAVGEQLAKSGQISTAAIDQVYEVRNHPLLDTLDNPDPYNNFDREKLIGLMVSYCDVTGSAYLIPEGNGWDWRVNAERKKGPPEFLWVVYPQHTVPTRISNSPIINYFQYFADKLPLQATLWFRHNHSLRDPYGAAFSPTQAGESYRLQEQTFNALFSQVMGLGPRPNLIATAKDPLMPPGKHEVDAFQIDLIRKQSAGYAGGVLINTGAWDFQPANYSPADLAGKELSEYDIYALAAIFDQPATYYTVESNLANLQAADAQHDRIGVQPRCKTIAGVFTRLAKSYDPRLMFKFDSGLNDDELVKAQADKLYVDMGAITINELNEEKKYPKKAYGDAAWLPGTLRQPDMITAEHEQGLATAKQAGESAGQQDVLAGKAHEEAADQQDHQQSMDKKQLEVDKKAADKPAPAPKRSLEDQLDDVIRSLEAQIAAEVPVE